MINEHGEMYGKYYWENKSLDKSLWCLLWTNPVTKQSLISDLPLKFITITLFRAATNQSTKPTSYKIWNFISMGAPILQKKSYLKKVIITAGCH